MEQTARQQKHSMQTEARQGGRRKQIVDYLEKGRKAKTAEQVQAFHVEHPDAPSDEVYDYHLMFEQGKMPQSEGEGFAFLPEEGYRNGRSRMVGKIAMPALTDYDVNSKSYQIGHWLPRSIVNAAKGAFEGVQGQIGGQMDKAVRPLFEGSPEGEEIYENILAQFDEHRFEPFGSVVSNSKVNQADTLAAAGEQLATELFEIGIDIMGAKATVGQKSLVKLGTTKKALSKFVRRLEEAVTPAVVGGEMAYAINPDNRGTMASMLGEALEEQWGMEGPVVEFLKTADDTPYTQAVAGVIEGMMLFEIGRTALRLGIRPPMAFWQRGKQVVDYARNMESKFYSMGGPGNQRGMMYWGGNPAYKDAPWMNSDMQKAFTDILPEDAEFDDVMESMSEFPSEYQSVFKALEKDDWLGFDSPAQALDALFSEDAVNYELSAGLKSALGRLVNK